MSDGTANSCQGLGLDDWGSESFFFFRSSESDYCSHLFSGHLSLIYIDTDPPCNVGDVI